MVNLRHGCATGERRNVPIASGYPSTQNYDFCRPTSKPIYPDRRRVLHIYATLLPLDLSRAIRITEPGDCSGQHGLKQFKPPQIEDTNIFVYIEQGFGMGFSEVKKQVIASLLSGTFSHEGREDIDDKNLLQKGSVTPQQVAEVLRMSRGCDHSQSPHHQDSSIAVHVVRCRDWYVKFYLEPDTVFISVHQ